MASTSVKVGIDPLAGLRRPSTETKPLMCGDCV
ncbi:hypothetical protein X743_05310 [Mesorhizobium sp. LNHC252B00]|nr:hypothetical protein X743_05310 [Mesorhizobium sp. LNHC252B00]